jgi:hypothetical protein
MTYSKDEDESILEEFDDYYVSVASNINSDSEEEDIAEFNEVVTQYSEELQEKLNKQKNNS